MGVVTSRSFLLDTHALLWALTAPHRLSDDARAAVADPTTDLVVSAASAWELTTKNRVGKLPQADSLLAGYPEHLDRLGYDEAWIGEHHSAGTEIIASPEIFIAMAMPTACGICVETHDDITT